MRHAIVLLTLAGLAPVSGIRAQESLCNPCVDVPPHLYQNPITGPEVPVQRQQFERGNTTVVTPEQMRALGIVSVEDMIAQIAGLNTADRPAGGGPGTGLGELTATRYFLFGGELDRLRWTIAELAPELDRMYEYVSARTGLAMPRQIVVRIAPPDTGNSSRSCPQRGMATNLARLTADFVISVSREDITIFVGPATTRLQLFGVLAHEVGHVLMFEWLGADYAMPGVAMGEGYASWAAGRYMTEWYAIDSFAGAVARLLRTNELIPPAEPVGPYYSVPADPDAVPLAEQACLDRRDRLYTEWGGFVEYLVGLDGADTVLALLRTASTPQPLASPRTLTLVNRDDAAPDSAPASQEAMTVSAPPPWGALDYRGVYGRELEALIADWLATVAD